jgi:MoxR-like ATPase
MENWLIYRGVGVPHNGIERLPPPPPWRDFDGGPVVELPSTDDAGRNGQRLALAVTYQADDKTIELVNTSLYLRRPLLITGHPGVGKSTLAYAIAHELGLGPVLRWPINSRSALKDGLYRYDAIGRVEERSLVAAGTQPDPANDIGRFLRLGPLGTALAPYATPRVVLVDEIDKSDIDLPNDLLDVFEEGSYEIPELSRIADQVPRVSIGTADDEGRIQVDRGRVRCRAFPIVILTSNGERDFPPAFLRRCVRLDLSPPPPERLAAIVSAHLGVDASHQAEYLVREFLARRDQGELATDQLLNAVYLVRHVPENEMSRERLAELVLRQLAESG